MSDMNIEKIKLIVDLTMAKVEILRLKADAYQWACFVDAETQEQLLATKDEIDRQLKELRA